IQRQLGVHLPVSALFRGPTLEALAREIDLAGGAVATTSQLVPLRTGGRRAPLVCIHAIDGGVYAYQQLAARLAPDRACYGFVARGPDGQPPLTSIAEMATLYAREWV